MSNILLASNNAVDSGATWYGDQDSSPFVLTQLADPNFSKIWRKTPGTNADGNMVKFAVSLATIARLNHLALCRHNFSDAAQIRVRAGTARLDVDFTDEAGLTSPYLTFSGGTNGTRTNEYGVMVSGTCPRYEHDRRLFENGVLSSEDLGPTGGWSSDSVYRYPDGQTVDFTKASSSVNQALTALRSLPAGTYEMKAQVRLVSGDGSFAFQLFDGQNFLLGSTNVATSDWKWFSSSLVSTGPGLAANSYAYILKQVAAGVLQIRRIQVRSGASNGKYTKTTNQRRYQRATTPNGYIDVWGGQTEFTYVTSLIPTTTTAASRSTDTAKVEASTWVPYVLGGQIEGTVYTEAMVNEIKCDTLRGASTIQFSDAGGTNHIDLYAAYTANDNFQYSDVRATYGGVAEVDLLEAAAAKGAVSRMAMHWRPNDYTAYMNGQGMGQDVGSDTFSAFTVIDLMYQPTSTAFLRRIAFWMTGKTTADLQAMSNSGPSAIDYDSGWSDALQMTPYTQLPALWGYDYDIIKSFTDHSVEWIRVGIYDPAKTSSSTPFEIGRLFTGKVKLQPGVNPSYGLADSWDDATTYAQTQSRRRIFNVLPKLRQVAFELGKLSLSEGDAAHEFDGTNGLSTEVLYLPDPSDEAKCQRYGFVGLMETLDALRWPLMNLRSKAYQITDKR
jgi:hypothetical protein